MDPTLQYLITAISQYGYLALFLLVFIEGPIASIIGGILAAGGVLNVIDVFLIILASNLLSDVIYYMLGRYGGRVFVKHFGHYLGVTESRIDSLEKHAQDHGGKTVLMAKLQIVGPIPTGIALLIALGVGRMPFGSYIWYNIIGTIPQTILLGGIGYAAGSWLMSAGSGPINIILGVFSLSILAVVGWWWVYRKKTV